MPIRLKDLENLLYRLITAPSGVGEGLALERHLPADGLGAIVRGDERISAEERVDIYANMYFYRLLEVLKEDFPATFRVLGDNNFHNLITGYLIAHPPTEPSALYCGRLLSDYLRDHPLCEQIPYLADLAALERSMVEVFHAADAVALDADTMRAVAPDDWPQFALRMHPASRILSLQWRVADLLRAVEEARDWKPIEAGAVKVLVWRKNSRVFYREIEEVEEQALAAASRGVNLAAVCELVGASLGDGDPVIELHRVLARWLGDGILVRIPRARRRRKRA